MKRRLLAMALSLVMLVGLFPTAAMAAGSGDASGGTSYRNAGQRTEGAVPGNKFTVYKDGTASGSPSTAVPAGKLSETAPDLTDENLYFDYAEVNGKRVYEAGTLEGQDITYYGSISGALSILGESETIALYYVSKYPVTYHVTGATQTAGDELVKKGDSLTFRVKPSGKGKNLVVSANQRDISGIGSVFDQSTGEMLYTIENIQEAQTITVQEVGATTYTLTYNQEEGAFRNGGITSPASGQSITPGGSIEVQMQSAGTLWERYVLNMLVINGHEVMTLPSNAGEGDYVESTLPSGETVRVTLTHEDYTDPWPPYDYTNHYTVTISNVYTNLYISEGNCKLDDRNEVIIKELSGIGDIVGWDGAADNGKGRYIEGSVNHVYQQTGSSGNEFYFNLKPGYKDPKLTVKVNGQVSDADVHFGENQGNLHDGREPSYTQEQYQYRFDLPNGLGDNVELFLTAEPITYSVEYRNDKNDNDLIGVQETGFTVVEGNKDTITITSQTPYETAVGFSPDGYILKGTENDPNKKVYHAGDTVKVADVAGYAQGGAITFIPNWVSTEELEERQITIHLYIEDPTNGSSLEAAEYLRTVGEGTALFRPNEERGREIIGEYITQSDHSWKGIYNQSDFILREGGKVQVLEEEVNALDFHFDVKKGTLTVNFQWGKGEQSGAEGTALPATITKPVAVKQAFSVDVSESIPEDYTASMTTVTGEMIEAGVEKTVYLYKDVDHDGKPDNYTITLTFDAKDDGTINTEDENLMPGGTTSEDNKKLTYKLTKTIPDELEGDKYPNYIPRVTVTSEGKGWLGWLKQGGSGAEVDRYASYAGKTVSENAENITFEAGYDIAEGYETVTINYYQEKEDEPETFTLHDSLERFGKIGETVTYPRSHVDGYVTPNEGTPGEYTVVKETNTVNVYYYQDKDGNSKPDTYTVTLNFQGTGHGSWDIEDTMWEEMEQGEDYSYTVENGIGSLKVFLVKTNEAGFEAETYPEAPKVKEESTWLFDSWQTEEGKSYGSGEGGDGITIGSTVGKDDTDESYQSVYKEDKNNDGTPDDQQYITITFQAGEHGTFAEGKQEVAYEKLLPGYSTYPEAPAVTENTGWQFVGWTPEYQKGGTIEQSAENNQTYKASYKKEVVLTYDGNAQRNGKVENVPEEETVLEGKTATLSTTKPTHSDVNGGSVVFIGWSKAKTTQIYGADDKEAFDKISLINTIVMGDQNVTVYAVWGYDANSDGKPDVQDTYCTVTAQVIGEGGSVTPGTAQVKKGGSQQFTIQANEKYALKTIAVDGEVKYTNNNPGEKFNGTWTLKDVTKGCTVTVVFGADTDGNGIPDEYDPETAPNLTEIVAPEAITGVANGTPLKDIKLPAQVTIHTTTGNMQANVNWNTEDTGYDPSKTEEQTVTLTGTVTLPEGVTNTNNVPLTTTISVTVKAKESEPDPEPGAYTVTASVAENGKSISPQEKTVNAGEDVVFTITAEEGYALDYITVNDKVVYSNNDTANPFQGTWTLKNVQANSTVVAHFGEDKTGGSEGGDGVPDEPTYLTITAQAGENGTIEPTGTILVERGESKHFTITADSGYHIADVTVNGKSVGAVSGYTLQNITENTTIVASFARNSSGTTRYTITASAGKGGKISPSGSVRVGRNSDKTFTITANEDYVISDVLVDGKSVGAVEKYTFEKVREKHTIEAVFALASGVADPEDTGVSDWLNTKDHTAYLSGYANGSFGPNKNMTRAEAAQMFYNLLLNQEVSGAVSFTDVAADAWYAKAVHTLASLGILQGVGDGRFAPDRAITRAEFTVIAMRFADLDTSGENIFTDVNAGDWFYDQVVGSIRYGWINGYEDGTFRPNNTITRAEVTTIVNRMLGRAADKDYVDSHKDQLRQFPDVAQTNWAYYNIVEATNAHDYEKSGGTEDWTGLAD